MIRQEHPNRNYVFRLFGTKEAAEKMADLSRKHNKFVDEVAVNVLSGWVLVNKNQTREIRDEYGTILNVDIIKEIEQLYYEQYP